MTFTLFSCQKSRPSAKALGLSLFLALGLGSSSMISPALAADKAIAPVQSPKTYDEAKAIAYKLLLNTDYQGARRYYLLALDLTENGADRAETHVSIGMTLANEDNWAVAKNWWEKAIREEGASISEVNSARLFIATYHINQKDFVSAEKVGRDFMQDPRTPLENRTSWWSLIAEGYADEGQFEEARNVLDTALRETNVDEQSHKFLKGELEKLEAKQKKANNTPRVRPGAKAGEVDEEERTGVRAGSDAYEYLYRKASEFALAKDRDNARRFWLQALAIAENGKERNRVQYAIAGSYYSDQKWAEARTWAQKVINEKDGYIFLYRNSRMTIASTYLQEQDYDNGIEAAKIILQDPKTTAEQWQVGWSIASSCFNNQGKHEQAIQVLEEALAEKGISKEFRDKFEAQLKSEHLMLAEQQKRRRN